jgi:hypothetical protein
MVLIQLTGGLGNQMFQYAFARSLDLKSKRKIYLDTSWLNNKNLQNNVTQRNYELAVFEIYPMVIQKNSIINYVLERKTLIQKCFFKIMRMIGFISVLKEKKLFKLDDELLLQINNFSYIEGYFQTDEYFKSFRTNLLNEFNLKNSISDNSLKYQQLISESNSVSLHVRRGDYISIPSASKIHNVCTLEYYKNAIGIITEKVNNPHFFIFSDDLDWVKNQNLTGQFKATYVTGNSGFHSFEDMILMSYCNHNIIANSSFSWWGAWLNTNIEKVVIAPEKWTSKTNTKSVDVSIIPEDWYII